MHLELTSCLSSNRKHWSLYLLHLRTQILYHKLIQKQVVDPTTVGQKRKTADPEPQPQTQDYRINHVIKEFKLTLVLSQRLYYQKTNCRMLQFGLKRSVIRKRVHLKTSYSMRQKQGRQMLVLLRLDWTVDQKQLRLSWVLLQMQTHQMQEQR